MRGTRETALIWMKSRKRRGKTVTADKLHGIDIDSEYSLIQEKKSRLASNIRKLVVQRYENQYN